MQNKAHGLSLLRKEADPKEVVTCEERAEHSMLWEHKAGVPDTIPGQRGAVTSLGKWQMQSQ